MTPAFWQQPRGLSAILSLHLISHMNALLLRLVCVEALGEWRQSCCCAEFRCAVSSFPCHLLGLRIIRAVCYSLSLVNAAMRRV